MEFYDQAVMSKELATINTHSDIDYVLEDAALDNLYTPEAYLLCKEWEFKNFLPRFEVEAPKNEAEEHFYLIQDRQAAEELFDGWKQSTGEKTFGCFFLREKDQCYGMAVSDGEKSYLLLTENGA